MNNNAIKIGFVSLGCSKNLIDTEIMLARLANAGYAITTDETEADVVIVNTCAFIESAKKESIENILDIAWLKEHNGLKAIIVTGCLAERYKEEIFTEIPEVDAVIGVGSIERIEEAVATVLSDERFYAHEDKDEAPLGGERIVTTGDHTAYIKIAEGCDNRCTYCAIPGIRGKFRSRTIEDIVEEAKELEEIGVKELNIIAQDTSRYGLDIYGEYALAKLVRAITDATSIPWIRLLYCYPDKITDELIAEMRDNDRVVKYIDLPIQHISDSVLKRMNRHGDGAMIRETVKKLRDNIPGITIRTTVMVGFPGETDEEFTELCEYVKEAEFDRLGAFTYSREEDTPAYNLPEQVDEQIKQERYDIIMRQQLHITEMKNENLIGKTIKVICEAFDPAAEIYFGRGEADAPDIDTKIYFRPELGKKRIAPGEFVNIKIDDVIDYDLIGDIVR
ncbi:MAG: 30S ribosomal protein S12 methylthiotransferase RimO [Clostridia bacterium]|nr:30S ribosomal protein S12 methylthiotransferase RimO [Clostridia bacterium]